MVPTSSPGFSCTPIVTVGGVATTASYYDDVRVPKDALVGELHGGWRLITGQLNHERVGLAAVSALAFRLWDEVAAWVSDQGLGDVAWIQQDLARTYALLEAQKLLTWRMTAAVAADTLGAADSSSVKVFGTESTVEIYRKLLGIVGLRRLPEPGLAGSRPPRRARAGRSPGPDQHVRRRGQRGPARDPGHGRTRHEAERSMSDTVTLDDKLQAFVGQSSGPATRGRHPVNEPMIAHWVEAMGDHNPVYVDEEAARDAGFPGIIAPPTMLQAWIMRGLRASLQSDAARDAGEGAGGLAE